MKDVDAHSLQLDTALVFDEIRMLATADERQRLAREIHDGIAQEVASLGYVVDDLAASSSDPEIAEGLRDLREELSRVVADLRLSIFDLRSDVSPTNGLGAALSDYVRTVGARSDLTVHLTLDEAPTRLTPVVEAELLRIAQEAVTNARKHASADNLWVDFWTDPPRARLVVRDDGTGMSGAREDSFGISIMRERAHRIDATLDIDTDRERRAFSRHDGTGYCDSQDSPPARKASPSHDCPTVTVGPTQVLLVDDHDLIRQGLARAFERQDDFEVCGQAASVAEGIRQFTALDPEVVITDVRLPDGLGFELVRAIRKAGQRHGRRRADDVRR